MHSSRELPPLFVLAWHDELRQVAAEHLRECLATKQPQGGFVDGKQEPVDARSQKAGRLLLDEAAQVERLGGRLLHLCGYRRHKSIVWSFLVQFPCRPWERSQRLQMSANTASYGRLGVGDRIPRCLVFAQSCHFCDHGWRVMMTEHDSD